MDHMRKCLFTGFEPFLQFKHNPTQMLANDWNGQQCGPYMIYSHVFPVDYRGCDQQTSQEWFLNMLSEVDLILLNGLDGKRNEISLETMAYNEISNSKPDNSGQIYSGEIVPGATARLTNSLIAPFALKIVSTLNLEINPHLQVSISNNPGRYLCNFIYYKILHLQSQAQENGAKKKPTCLFIHWPKTEDLGGKSGITQKTFTDLLPTLLTTIFDHLDGKNRE